MTSTGRLRLWLVAGTGDGSTSADATEHPPLAPAAARTKPTVMPQPFDAVEEHVGAVYRYALRLTGRPEAAEDLAQETLLRAWRSREKLRDPRVTRVWLLRIATNLWTDQLRQAKSQPRLLEVEPPCPRPTAIEKSNERENVARALAAMDQLPPRQRQVLHLTTCEELSLAEVSAVLEIEPSAVKASLSLARKEMRRRLSDVYNEVCGRRACREMS